MLNERSGVPKNNFFLTSFVQTISSLITVAYTDFKPFYRETTEKEIIFYSKIKIKNKMGKGKIKLGLKTSPTL